MSTVERATGETRVRATVARGAGVASVATGEPFLDHMLSTLARYSGLDISVEASGDLRHHVIEDVAIAAPSPVRITIIGCAVLPSTPGRRCAYGSFGEPIGISWLKPRSRHLACRFTH